MALSAITEALANGCGARPRRRLLRHGMQYHEPLPFGPKRAFGLQQRGRGGAKSRRPVLHHGTRSVAKAASADKLRSTQSHTWPEPRLSRACSGLPLGSGRAAPGISTPWSARVARDGEPKSCFCCVCRCFGSGPGGTRTRDLPIMSRWQRVKFAPVSWCCLQKHEIRSGCGVPSREILGNHSASSPSEGTAAAQVRRQQALHGCRATPDTTKDRPPGARTGARRPPQLG